MRPIKFGLNGVDSQSSICRETTLPDRPLDYVDADRLRTHSDIRCVISLETDPIRAWENSHGGGVSKIIVLSHETAYTFEYNGDEWAIEDCAIGATQDDVFDHALDHVDSE